MTNEQIEKRFLFDLEMGLFKFDENHQILFRCDLSDKKQKRKFIKLLVLLKNLGFSYNEKEYYDLDYGYIIINVKYKMFGLFIDWFGKENLEEIPEYINKYDDRRRNYYD